MKYTPEGGSEICQTDPVSQRVHEVTLWKLAADTGHGYYVESGPERRPSQAYGSLSFTTAPETPPDNFRFVVYGDNRGDSGQDWYWWRHRDVIDTMLDYSDTPEDPVRFVLHVADFAYNGGHDYEWNPQFFGPAQMTSTQYGQRHTAIPASSLIGRIALFPSLGNHEYNLDDEADNYRRYFSLPNNERWYSLNFGNCHFTVLDTRYRSGDPNPDAWFEENSQQHEWLKADLEGSGATWKFVVLHCPPYSHSNAHAYTAGDVTAVRVQLAQKVFNKSQYGVDAVFCGHNHFYEHSFKFYDGSTTQGVHYIVTGGGGADGGHDPWATGWRQNTARHCADLQLNLFHYCTVDVPAGSGNPVLKKWEYREDQPPEVVETVTIGQPPGGW